MKKKEELLNGEKHPIVNGRPNTSARQKEPHEKDISEYCERCLNSIIEIYERERWEGYSDYKRIKEQGKINVYASAYYVSILFLVKRYHEKTYFKSSFTVDSVWEFYKKFPKHFTVNKFLKDRTSINHSLNAFQGLGLLKKDPPCKGSKGYKNYTVHSVVVKRGLEWFFSHKNKYLNIPGAYRLFKDKNFIQDITKTLSHYELLGTA